MRDIFTKNIGYKITALILALLFWFYQNPMLEKTITGVAVGYTGLQEGLVVVDFTETADIRVQGAAKIIDPLKAQDLKVSIDLSQALEGETVIPLGTGTVTAPEGVEVIGTKPKNIQFFIDTLKERQLPVKVEYANKVAPGYSSFEPIITPSIIVVRGASQVLDKIETARVTVDLNNATDNLELALPIQLLDTEGKIVPLDKLQVSPDKVQVFVPVVRDMPTKTVIIKPVLVGTPQDGYVVARTVVEPDTMKISGSTEKLDQLDHILTRPIDITGINMNRTYQTGLDAPEGVSVLYHSMVKVTVQLDETPVTRKFEDVTLILENQPSGVQANLNPGKVNVTVKGPRAVIENLLMADIRAVIDLKGIDLETVQEEGITKEVRVILPSTGNIQLMEVEPSTVEITFSPMS